MSRHELFVHILQIRIDVKSEHSAMQDILFLQGKVFLSWFSVCVCELRKMKERDEFWCNTSWNKSNNNESIFSHRFAGIELLWLYYIITANGIGHDDRIFHQIFEKHFTFQLEFVSIIIMIEYIMISYGYMNYIFNHDGGNGIWICNLIVRFTVTVLTGIEWQLDGFAYQIRENFSIFH